MTPERRDRLRADAAIAARVLTRYRVRRLRRDFADYFLDIMEDAANAVRCDAPGATPGLQDRATDTDGS